MKLSKKASDTKRKVLNIYPTARLLKYKTFGNEGRHGIFVTKSHDDLTGFWLELDYNNSSTKGKAWIDAHKAIMHQMLKMFEF